MYAIMPYRHHWHLIWCTMWMHWSLYFLESGLRYYLSAVSIYPGFKLFASAAIAQNPEVCDVTAASKMVCLIIISGCWLLSMLLITLLVYVSPSFSLHSSISGSCGFVICLIFLCGFTECVTIFVQMAIKMRSEKKEQHLSVRAS